MIGCTLWGDGIDICLYKSENVYDFLKKKRACANKALGTFNDNLF